MKLTIVVPCFNEDSTLLQLHRRVTLSVEETVGRDFELILVNDGSRDNTWLTMSRLADADPRVVAVNLSRNHGHQIALSAGLSLARGDRVLVLDADLQDPPELLPKMMQLMDEGADVVYGQRVVRHGETIFKQATASLFYRLLDRLTDVPIPRDSGDFRLMSRRTLEVLNGMPERQRFVRGMVSWIGFRQTALPYERQPRNAGTSHYPLRRMIRLAFDAITSFSTRPLRIASLLGLMFAVMGCAGITISLVSWANGSTIPGWTSVMVVVLALGGIQLTVLGIMGEYLGRLYLEAKQRPLYVIDQIHRRGAQADAQLTAAGGSNKNG